jgi:acyl-CoA thioesterase I
MNDGAEADSTATGCVPMATSMAASTTAEHCTRRPVVAALLAAVVLPAWAQSAQPAQPAKATGEPVLLVVGDSLSAEYGLERGKGWVALLEARLAAEKRRARVVNASISGDTTSGGRSRLSALLTQHKPSLVVIELGGNDALRGLPLTMTKDNLAAMTRQSKDSGASVLLLGMQVPPNYGRSYGESFAKLFVDVAEQHKASLVPFFLAGVADVPNADALFQRDRIHPNEAAQPTMLANVWPAVMKLMR